LDGRFIFRPYVPQTRGRLPANYRIRIARPYQEFLLHILSHALVIDGVVGENIMVGADGGCLTWDRFFSRYGSAECNEGFESPEPSNSPENIFAHLRIRFIHCADDRVG
jgi:hypothetical protein